ncbi:MAG TPA: DUF4153 domain-containing protein [Marmoricola sp.]|nr:DUF4153 domain-containing protein [Marmoricola sp.]
MSEPLARVTSIKVKLGLLVAVSVTVAAVLATAGAGSVPALLSIPVTIALALAVTQLLASGMTAPLRQMTVAARRMAAGDYAVRVQATAADEVGEAARAFNRMAAELAGVDRQRRDLVATVSHELRTPLAGLVALLENIADGVTPTDAEHVATARDQAERLSGLVQDLLDLSRVDAGVLPLEKEPVDLVALVDAAVAGQATSTRGVRFASSLPAGLTVDADPRRLHQLLANLLDNAARHSPAGGTVRIRGGRDAGRVWVEVADDGPGVAPQDRDRIFERYGTGDPHGGGTGLGLAIARWVADLHGGGIALQDQPPGTPGAVFHVDLPDGAPPQPLPPSGTVPPPPSRSTPMPSTTAPVATPAAEPVVDQLFGKLWRDRATPARPTLLLGSLGVGVLAGLALPFQPMGLATSVVLLAAGCLVLTASRHRGSRFTWACAALCLGFAALPTLRAAEWLTVLGLLAAACLVTAAVVEARSVSAMLLAAAAWPLASLRGLPWLGRTVRALGGGRTASTAAVVRTTALAVLGVLVFGALFASADAVFGRWIGAVVPSLGPRLVLRVFVTVAVAGVVLAAAYLALNPPQGQPVLARRPAQHRFEWLVPVLVVDVVFAVFLLAQAAAFLGGHDYVRRTTGLTYADYVHQGFGQLTLATALTLLVVWIASRKAATGTPGDRWWLRASLGTLCLLTLVVVASALRRMDLYQQAYGFTRLRLVVDLFEGWLGLVVLGVLVAGARLDGRWLPRAALLTGAVLLLGLAAANPDGWIARHNLDRFEQSGRVDWSYLRGLSDDATPVLAELPAGQAACALGDRTRDGSWTSWNLGRARAESALRQQPPGAGTPYPSCADR